MASASPLPPSPDDSSPRTRSLRLTVALRSVLQQADANDGRDRRPLTLGLIVESTGERAFGVLMAFLCVPFLLPIPLPGISVPFGLALLILGAQISLRKNRPWLPQRLLRWHLPQRIGTYVISGIARVFQPLERIVRPRWLFMQNRAAMVLVGIALAVDGFLLFLPFPPIVPFSNALPAWMALIKILGLTEEDGISLLAGSFLTLAAVAALIILIVLGWGHITARF